MGSFQKTPHFADVCENCNIRFIGPSSHAMNALENKAIEPVLGQKGGRAHPARVGRMVENEQEALTTAKRIGYPVIIKAVAGGGGRGCAGA